MDVKIHAIHDLSDNAPECTAVKVQQAWSRLPRGSAMTLQGVIMGTAERDDINVRVETADRDVYRFPDGSFISGPPRFGELRKA
jgi:hypothetical protein